MESIEIAGLAAGMTIVHETLRGDTYPVSVEKVECIRPMTYCPGTVMNALGEQIRVLSDAGLYRVVGRAGDRPYVIELAGSIHVTVQS